MESKASSSKNMKDEASAKIAEATLWSSDKSVLECNRYMFENEIQCDLTFVVGEEGEEVKEFKVHKYICMSRCPVFLTMLCGLLAPADNRIVITDVSPDSFYQVLRYLYFEEVELTALNVVEIIYTAHKYQLVRLYSCCVKSCSALLDPSNVWQVLNLANLFDDGYLWTLGKIELEKHKKDLLEIIAVQDNLEMSWSALKRLIADDELYLPEETLFHLAIRWAGAACNRDKAITDKRKRAALRDVLYDIRFPTFSIETFTRLMANSDLLNKEEKLDVLFCHGDEARNTLFPKTPRRENHSQMTIPYVSNSAFVNGSSPVSYFLMNFHADKTMLVYSVVLFNRRECELCTLCEVVWREDASQATIVAQKKIPSEQHQLTGNQTISFAQPVLVKAHAMYQFQFTIMRMSPANTGPGRLSFSSLGFFPSVQQARQQPYVQQIPLPAQPKVPPPASVRVSCSKEARELEKLVSPLSYPQTINGIKLQMVYSTALIIKDINYRLVE